MDELSRKTPPEGEPAPVWFHLEPEALNGSRTLRRQAALAARITVRNLPRRRLFRAGWILSGLFLLGLALAAAWRGAFRAEDPAVWLLALPVLGMVLLAVGVADPLPGRQLRWAVDHFAGATFFATHLREEDTDWPLADLTLVRRFRGWTVLVWQRDTQLMVLPVPDAVCPQGGEVFYAALQQAAPGAACRARHRPPRQWPCLLVCLPLLPVLTLTLLFWNFSFQGMQLLSSVNTDSGSVIVMAYNRATGTLASLSSGPLPYPTTGEVAFQWQTDDCCALTYRATDNTLRVALLAGSLGTAQRLDPDPPTGSWRQYFLTMDLDTALRWDEASRSYLLSDEQGEKVYRQWEDFDGLGIALCNDNGVPQWTLVPTRVARWNANGTSLDTTALVLCPVTLDPLPEQTQLLPDDGSADSTSATPEAAAPQPTPAPAPTFDETVDVCLNEGGLYFTWDGGASYSQPMTHSDCLYYGVEEEADLGPLVLRQDTAAFLVTTLFGDATVYVTTDQGQSWQTSTLVQWAGLPDITHRCLGFTQDGFGYAAVSNDLTEGGDIDIALFTTDNGGISWRACATPKPDIDATRPVTGLIFWDADHGLASMASGDDNPWPHIFATTDGGASWRELPVNFASSGLTVATRLTGYLQDGDTWWMTVTQEPYGRQELVFRASAPDGPWAFVRAQDAG